MCVVYYVCIQGLLCCCHGDEEADQAPTEAKEVL